MLRCRFERQFSNSVIGDKEVFTVSPNTARPEKTGARRNSVFGSHDGWIAGDSVDFSCSQIGCSDRMRARYKEQSPICPDVRDRREPRCFARTIYMVADIWNAGEGR